MTLAFGGWGEFTAALALFLSSHVLPTRPPLRQRLVAAFGERGFALGYSLLSLPALAWLIAAAGRAPYVELWAPAPWQAWVPNLVMPLVFLLLAFGLAAPNPLSFGGARNDLFDPERPGVVSLSRHPLLLALALWALAHLAPNGDLAHALMFSLLGAFALLGMAGVDMRKRRMLGEARWSLLARRTSIVPLAAWLAEGAPMDMRGISLRRTSIALATYAVATARLYDRVTSVAFLIEASPGRKMDRHPNAG